MARATSQLVTLSEYERNIVDSLRYKKNSRGKLYPLELIARNVADHIINSESARGSMGGPAFIIADKRQWFVDKVEGRVYPLSLRSSAFGGFLAFRYGLAPAEKLTQMVVDLLQGYTAVSGARRQARRFSFYDREKNVLYLNRYDGTVYKLDGTSVTVQTNGQGTLFMDYSEDDGLTPKVDLLNDVKPSGAIKKFLIDEVQFKTETNAGTKLEEMQRLFETWLYVVAMPDLMPTKPLLLLDGEKGSGKTVAVQLAQYALLGQEKILRVSKDDEKDFGVTLIRSPIALIDNTDTMVPWMQDALASYTTGAGWYRRVLYSDDEVIEINPQSFLAFSSRNPVTFKRDDVADRCLILRLEPREGRGGFTDVDTLKQRIADNRAAIYGEWLYGLNRIVSLLKAGFTPPTLPHRMADFGRMAFLVGNALGHPQEKTLAMLDAAQIERDDLVAEGDTLIDILTAWLDGASGAAGREFTPQQIYDSLTLIAKQKHLELYHKSPSSLAKRLERQPKSLSKHVNVSKRTQGGQTLFTFKRS